MTKDLIMGFIPNSETIARVSGIEVLWWIGWIRRLVSGESPGGLS